MIDHGRRLAAHHAIGVVFQVVGARLFPCAAVSTLARRGAPCIVAGVPGAAKDHLTVAGGAVRNDPATGAEMGWAAHRITRRS